MSLAVCPFFNTTMKEINDLIKKATSLLEKAEKIALAEIVLLARKELNSSNEVHEFVMAMGSYFFVDKNNDIVEDYQSEELDTFIEDYKDIFCLTAESMRFTADGPIETDW